NLGIVCQTPPVRPEFSAASEYRVLAWPSPRNQRLGSELPSGDRPVPSFYLETVVWNLSEFEPLSRQPYARLPAVRPPERNGRGQDTKQRRKYQSLFAVPSCALELSFLSRATWKPRPISKQPPKAQLRRRPPPNRNLWLFSKACDVPDRCDRSPLQWPS